MCRIQVWPHCFICLSHSHRCKVTEKHFLLYTTRLLLEKFRSSVIIFTSLFYKIFCFFSSLSLMLSVLKYQGRLFTSGFFLLWNEPGKEDGWRVRSMCVSLQHKQQNRAASGWCLIFLWKTLKELNELRMFYCTCILYTLHHLTLSSWRPLFLFKIKFFFFFLHDIEEKFIWRQKQSATWVLIIISIKRK